MNYGDLGKRIVACIIDGIILLAISAILGFILSFVGTAIAPLVGILYYILMEGGGWHATLGKRMMGLYIADADGNGITYSTSILRYIGKILCDLTLCIGYLMALFNDEKQGLHDRIAKTYVLNGQAESGRIEVVRKEDVYNMPELVGINGPLAGKIYKITDNGLVIGRDSVGCQVVVPASQAKVSRIHCYVSYNQNSGMFVLNDRNSTHGTYLVNGTKISYAQPVALKSGDRFYLATPENTFEVR